MAPAGRKRRPVADESDEDRSEEEAPRNTQRRRQNVQPDEESDDDADNSAVQPDVMDVDAGEGSKDQLVKKLVRYALACEYSRIPIKRDGIRDKVFGKHKTPFKQVFDAAQSQLREKFGMEMAELPMKEKVTLKERRAAAQKPGQSANSSKTYILVSTLPPEYAIPKILPPSKVPTATSEAEYVGLYTMIISLISLAGGRLGNAKLTSYLARLEADENMAMEKTDAVLLKMQKQGYIIKVKETNDGEESIDWYVGPRGKVEVGNRGISGLVREVYGENPPEDLEDRLKKSLGLSLAETRDEDAPDAEPAAQNGARVNGRGPGRPRRAAAIEDD